MGNDRTQHEKPDLTSAEGIGAQPSNTGLDEAPVPPSPKTILPRDLPKALRYLEDQELDRLAGAALGELRRRGRLPPGFEPPSAKSITGAGEQDEKKPARKGGPTRRGQTQIAAPTLTRGQVNAVRAAFKAGITPSRIARQFGLTQSDVRKALAADKT